MNINFKIDIGDRVYILPKDNNSYYSNPIKEIIIRKNEIAIINDYGSFICNHNLLDSEQRDTAGNLYFSSEEKVKTYIKQKSIKTRQSEFLKHNPFCLKAYDKNCKDFYLNICPEIIDERMVCERTRYNCSYCKKQYWLTEINENE